MTSTLNRSKAQPRDGGGAEERSDANGLVIYTIT